MSMRHALERAAVESPELRKQLDEVKKEAEKERRQLKREQTKKKAEEKTAAVESNRSKDIYIWRTKIHGAKYSMRSGFTFANSLEEATDIVESTYKRDVITYIGKADLSATTIETGMYIE